MSTSLAILRGEESEQIDRMLVSTFLENIPYHVFFKDRQSRFIAVSRSLMVDFGCTSPDQIVGRTDFDFFSPVHAQRAFDDEQQIIRTGIGICNQLERETWPDGSITWALTSKQPLRDQTGAIIGTFGLSRDITEERNVELALETAQKELVEASRVAGMAEVATGVLHNVGNVLNSLNVSASVITTTLRQSRADSLAKIAAMLREHQGDLVSFLTDDPKGKRIPEFLTSLARHAAEEHARMLREISALQNNVDHIKEIVSMQQTYATMVGVVEPLEPAALMEDALRMNAGALVRHEVEVEREFESVPAIMAEKAKVIQILVNLIRNAKFACDETGSAGKRVTLRIRRGATPDRVQLIVSDNGVGIPAENLTRIFGHGFTTRRHGHGFGLHSAANAAREMKGSLAVHSDGRGTGATFTLELPVAVPAVAAA